jgi:hypothetical protein
MSYYKCYFMTNGRFLALRTGEEEIPPMRLSSLRSGAADAELVSRVPPKDGWHEGGFSLLAEEGW